MGWLWKLLVGTDTDEELKRHKDRRQVEWLEEQAQAFARRAAEARGELVEEEGPKISLPQVDSLPAAQRKVQSYRFPEEYQRAVRVLAEAQGKSGNTIAGDLLREALERELTRLAASGRGEAAAPLRLGREDKGEVALERDSSVYKSPPSPPSSGSEEEGISGEKDS